MMDDHSDLLKLLNMSTKEHVENERLHFREEYDPVFQILNPRIAEFFQKHVASSSGGSPSNTFPAVDIGSGRAIGTATMALTLRPPLLPEQTELLWYPSDWAGEEGIKSNYEKGGPLELETRETLRYLVQESQEPLFTDQNDEPVFLGDPIELKGLKAVHFNGNRGYVRGPDPNAVGRFAIQISPDPNDCKSFKQENISYLAEMTPHDAMLRHLRKENKAKEFFKELLERTREINVLKHESWSNVEELYGKCALVTCTSLLTCLGYRDPTAWKDTMQLASKLLVVDGYLLQYDAIGYANFGDTSVMQAFVRDESLGLKLEASIIPPLSWHNGRERKLLLWQKV